MKKISLFVVAALVILSGCGNSLDGEPSSETPSLTTAPGTSLQTTSHSISTTTTSNVDTSSSRPANLTDEEVGERAVAAEEDRIETVLSELDNVTAFSVDDVAQSEYTVLKYNNTGAIVIVRGVHSGKIECDDGEGLNFDGARTETQYFVTEASTRLIQVNERVYGLSPNPCS